MSLQLLIGLYVILDIFVVNAFFSQRAVLDICRKYYGGVDLRSMVLPKWYKFIRIPQIITWIILAYMLYEYPWYWAVGIFVIDFAITSLLPVPKSKCKWAEEKINEFYTHA